jgi:hypothetical protein
MGGGYWILLWDSWGSGLTMVNPRLYAEGIDMYGNPKNWFPCPQETSDDTIADLHRLDDLGLQYSIIRSESIN